jgi:hypothetical protein
MTVRTESVSSLTAEISAKRAEAEKERVSLEARAQEARESVRVFDAQLAVLRRLTWPQKAPRAQLELTPTSAPADPPRHAKGDSLSNDILNLVSSNHGGLTSSDIADRLAPTLKSNSKKPPRRTITNRISLLKKREKIVEVRGKWYLFGR